MPPRTGIWSTGFKYKTRLPRIQNTLRTEVDKRAWLAANEVRTAILKGFARPKHGKLYRVPGTRKKYRASAPGEYPANRTGRLRSSVRAVVLGRGTGEVVGVVGTDVHYGIYLEFGTKFMQRRPWLTQAFWEVRQKVWDILTGEWELL